MDHIWHKTEFIQYLFNASVTVGTERTEREDRNLQWGCIPTRDLGREILVVRIVVNPSSKSFPASSFLVSRFLETWTSASQGGNPLAETGHYLKIPNILDRMFSIHYYESVSIVSLGFVDFCRLPLWEVFGKLGTKILFSWFLGFCCQWFPAGCQCGELTTNLNRLIIDRFCFSIRCSHFLISIRALLHFQV